MIGRLTRSTWLCRLDRLDHHLIHPTRILLFQLVPRREGSSQVDGIGAGSLRDRRYGILVGLRISLDLALDPPG